MTVLQFLQATWWDSLSTVILLIVSFSVFLLSIRDLVRKPKKYRYRLDEQK
jgi:hypothetical protein